MIKDLATKALAAITQFGPFPVAIACVLALWYGWTKKDLIIKFLKDKVPNIIPTTPKKDVLGGDEDSEINEVALKSDPRHQVFYYLERIRKYAEVTKNTDAIEHCVMLLNDLFKVYPEVDAADLLPQTDPPVVKTTVVTTTETVK